MSNNKAKDIWSAHKHEIVHIGCFAAGMIVMYAVGKATSRSNYIVTDFTVGDLGKLGEQIIKQGHDASDKVLYWKITAAGK